MLAFRRQDICASNVLINPIGRKPEGPPHTAGKREMSMITIEVMRRPHFIEEI
jgi:hypothetical protein